MTYCFYENIHNRKIKSRDQHVFCAGTEGQYFNVFFQNGAKVVRNVVVDDRLKKDSHANTAIVISPAGFFLNFIP